MNNYTHQTAPTQFVEVAGIRFAYRRFASRRFGAKFDTPCSLYPEAASRCSAMCSRSESYGKRMPGDVIPCAMGCGWHAAEREVS